jgi:subtilisin
MRVLGSVAVVAVTMCTIGATQAPATERSEGSQASRHPDTIAGSYIVVLDPSTRVGRAVTTARRFHGAAVDEVYSSALHGYSAQMSSVEAAALAGQPGVSYVQPDVRVELAAQPTPTGVNRANADRSPTAGINRRDRRVNVDVAVIDTGVDLNHRDLNVFRPGARNCSSAPTPDDGNGHGTHVAGTIGALDNRRGVVGVAPGARIWPVRVLAADGSGTMADVICGIDYVTRNARRIEVANLSLGGPGPADDGNCGRSIGDAMHQAICASVRAGVTYAVAAGNSSADAALTVPASYNEVITVSAMADFNGRPGGGARSTCRPDVDDTFADFSNFGRDVDLVAPGVCIRSTLAGGRYATMSGTSMAAPHVAGGAALFAAKHPAATPARVRGALVAAGNAGWSAADDPDGTKEPLLDVSGF